MQLVLLLPAAVQAMELVGKVTGALVGYGISSYLHQQLGAVPIGSGPLICGRRRPRQQAEDKTDLDFCADALELLLKQAVEHADETYLLAYTQLSERGKLVPRLQWRKQPVEIWCTPDLLAAGHIDCYASVQEIQLNGPALIHSIQIARYFVAPKAELETDGSSLRSHFGLLETDLKTYAFGEGSTKMGACLQALFKQSPLKLRLISPYHPEASSFELLVFKPGEAARSFQACLVPAFQVPSLARDMDVLQSFACSSPTVFLRLFADPLFPVSPAFIELFPPVHPRPSQESRRSLRTHLEDAQEALKQFYLRYETVWECENAHSPNRSMPHPIYEVVLHILQEVERDLESTMLLDCSQPLPMLSGSTQCPRTKGVLGSSMWTRAMCRAGLWIALRGQNWVESATGSNRYGSRRHAPL